MRGKRKGSARGTARLVEKPWLRLYSLKGSKMGGVGVKKGALGDILPYSPLLQNPPHKWGEGRLSARGFVAFGVKKGDKGGYSPLLSPPLRRRP